MGYLYSLTPRLLNCQVRFFLKVTSSGLFWLHEIPAWIGMPLTVFLVVYITNAINLIDGVDGLASGTAKHMQSESQT